MLTLQETKTVFNTLKIQPQALMRARYHTWEEPRNGIVLAVDKYLISVLFLPLVDVATRLFTIKATEVAEGKWQLLWTEDFEDIGKEMGSGTFFGNLVASPTDRTG